MPCGRAHASEASDGRWSRPPCSPPRLSPPPLPPSPRRNPSGGGKPDPAVMAMLLGMGRALSSFPADFAAAISSGKVNVDILKRYLDLEAKFGIGWLMQFSGGCGLVGGWLCGWLARLRVVGRVRAVPAWWAPPPLLYCCASLTTPLPAMPWWLSWPGARSQASASASWPTPPSLSSSPSRWGPQEQRRIGQPRAARAGPRLALGPQARASRLWPAPLVAFRPKPAFWARSLYSPHRSAASVCAPR